MAGLDDLNDDLQSVAGETPPVVETTPAQDGKSGYDLVADLLPIAKHKAFGAWCMRYKIGEDDPIFGEKLAADFTFESAAAAAKAAVQVSQGVNAIPEQIFSGAVKASDEVKGGLVAGGKLFAEAFTKAANDRQTALIAAVDAQQSSILSAATIGAEKIKTAASTLTASLDKAIEAKKGEGINDFAKAAATAAQSAARASMAAQIGRSAMVSVLAFLVAMAMGAGGLWGWLLITHRVVPSGVVAMADPLRGGDLLIVPDGGKVVPSAECPAGICLVYKPGSIPVIP